MKRLLLVLGALVLAVNVADAASGCSPRQCVPRVGSWSAPSPQHLTSSLGSTALKLTVDYRRAGKKVKSTYGNTLAGFNVYLRYFCSNPSTPWTESGFATTGPIAIPRNGKLDVKIPENYAFREHRLVIRFKRETFSGRLSGTSLNSENAVCSTSVSFSGKLGH